MTIYYKIKYNRLFLYLFFFLTLLRCDIKKKKLKIEKQGNKYYCIPESGVETNKILKLKNTSNIDNTLNQGIENYEITLDQIKNLVEKNNELKCDEKTTKDLEKYNCFQFKPYDKSNKIYQICSKKQNKGNNYDNTITNYIQKNIDNPLKQVFNSYLDEIIKSIPDKHITEYINKNKKEIFNSVIYAYLRFSKKNKIHKKQIRKLIFLYLYVANDQFGYKLKKSDTTFFIAARNQIKDLINNPQYWSSYHNLKDKLIYHTGDLKLKNDIFVSSKLFYATKGFYIAKQFLIPELKLYTLKSTGGKYLDISKIFPTRSKEKKLLFAESSFKIIDTHNYYIFNRIEKPIKSTPEHKFIDFDIRLYPRDFKKKYKRFILAQEIAIGKGCTEYVVNEQIKLPKNRFSTKNYTDRMYQIYWAYCYMQMKTNVPFIPFNQSIMGILKRITLTHKEILILSKYISENKKKIQLKTYTCCNFWLALKILTKETKRDDIAKILSKIRIVGEIRKVSTKSINRYLYLLRNEITFKTSKNEKKELRDRVLSEIMQRICKIDNTEDRIILYGSLGQNPISYMDLFNQKTLFTKHTSRNRMYFAYKGVDLISEIIDLPDNEIKIINSYLSDNFNWELDTEIVKHINKRLPKHPAPPNFRYGMAALKKDLNYKKEDGIVYNNERLRLIGKIKSYDRYIKIDNNELDKRERFILCGSKQFNSYKKYIYHSGRDLFDPLDTLHGLDDKNAELYLEAILKIGLPQKASISGTLDVSTSIAGILGLINSKNDIIQSIISFISFMVLSEDHSVVEILESARTFGFEYKISPILYDQIFQNSKFIHQIKNILNQKNINLKKLSLEISCIKKYKINKNIKYLLLDPALCDDIKECLSLCFKLENQYKNIKCKQKLIFIEYITLGLFVFMPKNRKILNQRLNQNKKSVWGDLIIQAIKYFNEENPRTISGYYQGVLHRAPKAYTDGINTLLEPYMKICKKCIQKYCSKIFYSTPIYDLEKRLNNNHINSDDSFETKSFLLLSPKPQNDKSKFYHQTCYKISGIKSFIDLRKIFTEININLPSIIIPPISKASQIITKKQTVSPFRNKLTTLFVYWDQDRHSDMYIKPRYVNLEEEMNENQKNNYYRHNYNKVKSDLFDVLKNKYHIKNNKLTNYSDIMNNIKDKKQHHQFIVQDRGHLNKKYNIDPGSFISLDHLIALFCYKSGLLDLYISSFNTFDDLYGDPFKTAKIKFSCSAHMARLIQEASDLIGYSISCEDTYYNASPLKSLRMAHPIIKSFTSSKQVAINFSTQKGFCPIYDIKTDKTNLRGIDFEKLRLSYFTSEEETFIFNTAPFIITKIMYIKYVNNYYTDQHKNSLKGYYLIQNILEGDFILSKYLNKNVQKSALDIIKTFLKCCTDKINNVYPRKHRLACESLEKMLKNGIFSIKTDLDQLRGTNIIGRISNLIYSVDKFLKNDNTKEKRILNKNLIDQIAKLIQFAKDKYKLKIQKLIEIEMQCWPILKLRTSKSYFSILNNTKEYDIHTQVISKSNLANITKNELSKFIHLVNMTFIKNKNNEYIYLQIDNDFLKKYIYNLEPLDLYLNADKIYSFRKYYHYLDPNIYTMKVEPFHNARFTMIQPSPNSKYTTVQLCKTDELIGQENKSFIFNLKLRKLPKNISFAKTKIA